MNYYYNPYNAIPYSNLAAGASKTGLFSNILSGVKGIKWSTLFTNTQKTLGFINQAIPVVKQVTPVVKNARTMFRVMNEFKKVDEPTTTTVSQTNSSNTGSSDRSNHSATPIKEENFTNDGPTFFI